MPKYHGCWIKSNGVCESQVTLFPSPSYVNPKVPRYPLPSYGSPKSPRYRSPDRITVFLSVESNG
jgi:hypothetical protein